MKKIFVSLLILAASLNALATDFAVATLTLKGSTSLEQGEVTLVKTDDPAASSFCAPLYINQYDVVIYAISGSEKYQIWANADLTNFPLGIKTYSDASYTITVSNVSGSETLSLYDVVADQTIALTEGQTYPFTAATNSFINDRFIINYVAPATGYTVTPNAAGYATFSAAEATVIPSGVTAVYRGVIADEELQLSAITGYVPANTGVIVEGVAGTDYNFAIASTSVDALSEANDLRPTSAYSYPMENVYVLKGNAFLEYVGTNALAANKAYIQLPAAGPNNAPKRIRMVINGATDVENVEAESVKAEKFVENGQVYIRRGNEVYNLQGQKVNF